MRVSSTAHRIGAALTCTCVLMFGASRAVAADEGANVAGAMATRPELRLSHAIYVELLGKAGLYGLGYELHLGEWVHVGAAAGVWGASGAVIASAAPYVGVDRPFSSSTPAHRWVVQVGPEIVYQRESGVLGFDGLSSTAIGGQLSISYELRRRRWFGRAGGTLTFGSGGWAPWLGLSGGLRL